MGTHHAVDKPLDGTTTARSYRYLKNTGKVKGVIGYEDEEWNVLAACGIQPASRSTPTPFTGTPRPLIIDTDMAGDDWTAILYLLNRPDVSIEAITVTGTGEAHCEPGIRNAMRLTALAGQPDIPVSCGRETPLQGNHAFPTAWRDNVDALAGLTLPDNPASPAPQSAVELLTNILDSSSDKTTILTLGPLTNLAELLLAVPEATNNIDMVYIMGGAVDVAGNVGYSNAGIDKRHGIASCILQAMCSIIMVSKLLSQKSAEEQGVKMRKELAVSAIAALLFYLAAAGKPESQALTLDLLGAGWDKPEVTVLIDDADQFTQQNMLDIQAAIKDWNDVLSDIDGAPALALIDEGKRADIVVTMQSGDRYPLGQTFTRTVGRLRCVLRSSVIQLNGEALGNELSSAGLRNVARHELGHGTAAPRRHRSAATRAGVRRSTRRSRRRTCAVCRRATWRA